MTTHFFTVTLRLQHLSKPTDVQVVKGQREQTEYDARRAILNEYLARGIQVKRIDRLVRESA